MQEILETVMPIPNIGALDMSIRVQLNQKLIGISAYGNNRPISIWLSDDAIQGDVNIVSSTLALHDPVFISCDKTLIRADDTDRCTIAVNAPKVGALPVVLSVVVNDSTPVDFPIPLTAGVGSDYLTCKDPGTIKVSVKNGVNRCVDVLTIQAV